MNPVTRTIIAFVGLTLGAGALAFGAGAPPERCPQISVERTQAAAAATVGWIVDNQRPDGTWLYEYDRVADVEIDDYNIVRHAGVMSALYQAGARGYDGAFDSADRGLAWALDHLVERDDWAGVTTSNTLQTGTNALIVAALAERRQFTGDTTYDEVLGKLGRFLTSQVEPSGALLAYYDLGPDRPRPDTYSIYYTGEAYWALGRLHHVDPAAGWGAYRRHDGPLHGNGPRRHRGHLATARRPLVGIRAGRDGGIPRAPGRTAADRRRASLRAPPGRPDRSAGPLDQPTVRALGRRRARHLHPPRRRLRRVRRRPDRALAGGPARRPARRRAQRTRRACDLHHRAGDRRPGHGARGDRIRCTRQGGRSLVHRRPDPNGRSTTRARARC